MGNPGSAIRAMREAQELSLRDLAHMSDTSYAYLSLVERGLRTPTDRWMRSITEALANNMSEESA